MGEHNLSYLLTYLLGVTIILLKLLLALYQKLAPMYVNKTVRFEWSTVFKFPVPVS